MFEILPGGQGSAVRRLGGGTAGGGTHDRTLEKSADGDITKLSELVDHDIRCWMLGSSSMLSFPPPPLRSVLGRDRGREGRLRHVLSLV